MTLRLSPFLALLAVLLFSACNTQQKLTEQSADTPIEFTIVQLNDVYEIAPLEGGKTGGLARVAHLIKQLETENPNTIAVLAGDFLSPTFMNTLKLDNGERIAGLQMVETLNAMGLDFATLGNHEFDLKSGELLEKRLAQSEFTYVTSNAFYKEKDGSTRPFTQGDKDIKDYATFTVTSNGQSIKVALVGVVLPFNNPDYVSYTDVNTSFAKAAARAEQEAEVVLGLTHLNMWEDEALAAATPTEIPLFMGGHEHINLTRFVDETAILKADANAKTVYVHRFTYYPKADVCKLHAELVPITDAIASEPTTEKVVQSWQDKIDGMIEKMGYDPKQRLATINPPLEGTEAAIRNKQTNYGALTNKALEYVWPSAHAYVFNSGSLRLDDNLSGAITAYDILRSFPYGGPIVQVSMSGDELEQLLNIGTTTNKDAGGYLQRRHAEKRGDEWFIRGIPIDNNITYKIVMPSFLASGREDNLGFLGQLPKEEKEVLTVEGKTIKNDIRDIIINYLLD